MHELKLLPNLFVLTFRSKQQLTVCTSIGFVVFHTNRFKSLANGASGFIGRQNAFTRSGNGSLGKK